MVERQSPLGAARRPGAHGHTVRGAGVRLAELPLGSIAECAAWPGEEKALMAAITRATGLVLLDGAGAGAACAGKSAFGIAPGRVLVTGEEEGMAAALRQAIGVETGTVTDLSHGRTAIRISGDKAEWVLAKFFALDFSLTAFPVGCGRTAQHHDIFAQISRHDEMTFDVIVFRSFARSFWTALCHGAEETGYEVV